MVEDDDVDADSVTASAADHSFVQLSKFFSDRYPESRPPSSPSLPPRCGLSHFLRIRILRGPLVCIFDSIRE